MLGWKIFPSVHKFVDDMNIRSLTHSDARALHHFVIVHLSVSWPAYAPVINEMKYSANGIEKTSALFHLPGREE